jgi:hypothetical protein
MEQKIINEIKNLIKLQDLNQIELYYKNLNTLNYDLDIQTIYKEILLYSCYKGNQKIITFFLYLYYDFDDISKIALRQLFFYCKYILKNQKKNTDFLEDFLTTIRNNK